MTQSGGLLQRWVARGFSTADLLNLLQPRRGWIVEQAIAYRGGPRGKLDVYRPAASTAAPAPVVVFFYGGSWQSGTRDIYRFVGASLAAQGIVTIIPDYRVYPEVRYPEFLNDAAAAVQFARDTIGRWNGDASRLTLMGHSAGAYIAAMLTFDKRWLGGVGVDPNALSGLIGLAGPYDFLPIQDPILQEIFGGPSPVDTQPIRYVGHGTPPALLIAPRHDTIVSPGNTRRLAAQLRSVGGIVNERLYGRLGHLSMIGTFSPLLRFLAPVFADVTAFAHKPGAM